MMFEYLSTCHVSVVEAAARRAAEMASAAARPVGGGKGSRRGRPVPPALHHEAHDHRQEEQLQGVDSILLFGHLTCDLNMS